MTNTIGQKNIESQRLAQNSVIAAIQGASARTGVNFAYLVEKAAAESNFDPSSKSKTSSATGLYQFVDQTWLDMIATHGQEHGLSNYAAMIDRKPSGRLEVHDAKMKREILDLRKDPKIAALMAAEYTSENHDYLEKKVGGDIGSTELYLAHFMGAGGAAKFLNAMKDNPDASGARLFPAAARANKNVFFEKNGQARSLSEIHAFFDKKFDGDANVQVASNTPPQRFTAAPVETDGQSMGEKALMEQMISDLNAERDALFSRSLSGASSSGGNSVSGFMSSGRIVSPVSVMILSQMQEHLTRSFSNLNS